MRNEHILIVDDEASIRAAICSVLSEEGYHVSEVRNGEEALEFISKETPDVVLLDIWLPGIDGLEVLKKMKEAHLPGFVIVMSGHGTIETAVKATKLGAYDFIEKPLSLDKLLLTIKNLLSIRELKEENKVLRQKIKSQFEMIFQGTAMQKLVEQIRIAAPTHSWILITGENGTGKELVARKLHEGSIRRDRPFIEVNCAAIPEELIESELFGHEKGAFTGATTSRRGKFDLAHGGTLFLDEIGDMSLKTQAKILRVLQEQKFERVGGTITFEVDVRVIGATNKNLQEEIKQGRFREDLYYRLNVIPIHVPPLRERKEDICVLAEFFLKSLAQENGKRVKRILPEALEALGNYDWPGNVRELRNTVERLFIMTPSDVIGVEDIPASILEAEENLTSGRADDFRNAKMKFEKEYIQRKLKEFEGNVSKTAKAIGIERTNLHRKIKNYQIEL
ncbi:MAG: sigma-54-dependent Fis family transcriptional regulator [Deltaproteobacteria bacterium]|nr:sigma-54-dependent Fis family transcriptional regulator [Deltaproteobacteria bacterium]